jgi:Carboxypeptidase regulatory-like domain
VSEQWEITRRQLAAAGRVIDARTGKALQGATVTMTAMPVAFQKKLALKALQYGAQWSGMPERLDRRRSRLDGSFYFMDLPDGDYQLSATLPGMGRRYGNAEAAVNVSRDNTGRVKVAFVDLALQPTVVEGKITGAGQKGAVAMAQVRVQGSGEQSFSDTKGHYTLACVEPGERSIQAFAQGYRPAVQKVSVKTAGGTGTLNFSLTKANS